MNLKPYLTPVRVIGSLAGVVAFVLLLSFVAGQCKKWSKPKTAPAVVDPGVPVAGPSSSAPTVTEEIPIARPDLTVAQLREAAKKYGLTLTTLAPKPTKAAALPVGLPAEIESPAPAQTFPMLLAEESFKHAPSGADVDVAAWLPAYGQRVDLRASWREWTPPPALPTPKSVVCQSGGFFRNEARWEKEAGIGALVTPDGIGPGGYGSAVFRGPSTGAANWGARGLLAAGQVDGETTGFGLISGKVSW